MLPEWLAKNESSAPGSDRMIGTHSFIDKTLSGVESFFRTLENSERFAARQGLLQKVDPRVKLVTIGFIIVSVTLTHQLSVLGMLYAMTLVLSLLSRLPFGGLLLQTWLFVPLFTVLMVFPVIFGGVTPGPALVTFGPTRAFTITSAGLLLACLIVLRVATAISWTLLLLWTTRWSSLFGALQVIRVPQALVMTLGMTIRYLLLFVCLVEETHLALKSRILRGLPRHQGQSVLAGILVTMFRKSLLWSEEIYGAMVSRGYAGRVVLLERRGLSGWDGTWVCLWMIGMVQLWRGIH
ncbi:MAG: cobalt ECF transporter T component CbiQ [Elusimicrobiota bacterium]|jgi:cobalt/nickel transport system permease protein